MAVFHMRVDEPTENRATPQRDIRAGVFDMEGVLLDSEPFHHQAVNEILREEGRPQLSFAEYLRYLGATDEYTWRDLVVRRALRRPRAEYRARFDTKILEAYRERATIGAGVIGLLDDLSVRGVPLAIASSCRRTWIEASLGKLRIRGYFDAIVSGDLVAIGKPDPAIHLLAAELLGVPAAMCFAVEDSPKGISAARAAGMLTFAVRTPYTPGKLTTKAHVRLRSLTDFDCSRLFDLETM